MLWFLALFVISSCSKKEDDTMTNEPAGQILEVIITASINGVVVDEAQNPLENVTVRVGNNTILTDIFGIFNYDFG